MTGEGAIAHITVDDSGDGVAAVTFNRPAKRNAFSLGMWHELARICKSLSGNDKVRAIVFGGAGGHFCAGADISEFSGLRQTAEGAQHYQEVVEHALQCLEGLGQPTIAAIEGACVGGGLGIALSCDLRIARNGARFAITPAKIGLVYSSFETRSLENAVGRSWAKRILFTGELIDSDTALRIGLVNEIVEGSPHEAGAQIASGIAANAPLPIRAAKLALSDQAGQSSGVDVERIAQTAIRSQDYAEGISAFLEKRRANFRGC